MDILVLIPIKYTWLFTFINIRNISFRAGIAQWVQRLGTDVLHGPENKPRCERFSAILQTVSGDHIITYAMGTDTFPGVNRPELGLDRPLISSVEIKVLVRLYGYSRSGPSGPVLRWTLTKIFKIFLCKLYRYFINLGLKN